MADRKPLVISNTGQLQQLQRQDDINIPLEKRFAVLKEQFRMLLEVLYREGVSLPRELKREI